MFKVVDIKSLKWPVTISVPKNDGSGDYDDYEVKVEYKVYDTDGLTEDVEGQTHIRKDLNIENEILGWEDIYKADAKPMPFTKANLKKMMKTPYIKKAFIEGFWYCQAGYAGKNS